MSRIIFFILTALDLLFFDSGPDLLTDENIRFIVSLVGICRKTQGPFLEDV